MNETLGEILRTRRQDRGLSLNGLALKAGIGKATLSAWENDKAQARLTELEAVCNALNLTVGERQEILRRLDAPRAIQVLRQTEADSPPVGGDLLRAMRLRQGRTQQDTASQIGVAQATLAKWERSDDWPAAERLHALCFVLRGRPEEFRVLCAGRFLPAPLIGAEFDPAVLMERLAIARHDATLESEALRDLRFLSIEADLWNLRGQNPQVEGEITGVYSEHAVMLAERGRMAEAHRYAERALARARRGICEQDIWLSAALVAAKCAGHPSKNAQPAAADLLINFLPQAKFPERRAWMHSDIALYQARAGDLDSALTQSRMACEIAQDCRWPGEFYFRQCDRAKILLLAGRPGEARELCLSNQMFPDANPTAAPLHLLLAEAHLALKETAQARHWLALGQDAIENLGLEQYRPQANALETALTELE